MTWQDIALKHAEKDAPHEACGLLTVYKGKEKYFPCKNIAEEAGHQFIIDPDDWVKAEDAGEVIAVFHSHPNHPPTPGQADLASCEYLDLPFRAYSSGMKSRLALSSALNNTPDILLIDEFFSTGDLNFTKKSRDKIEDIIDKSSIMLFASHDLDLIKKICTKAIYMKNGSVEFFGDVEKASDMYQTDYN